MQKYSNECCGCGIRCEPSCELRHVLIRVCDICGAEGAEYHDDVEDEDYCANCVDDIVNKKWLQETLIDKIAWANQENTHHIIKVN